MAQVHRIRITLTSRNVKNLEKGACQSQWWSLLRKQPAALLCLGRRRLIADHSQDFEQPIPYAAMLSAGQSSASTPDFSHVHCGLQCATT